MSEKSCSDWLKEMAAAGFDGTFKATSNGQTFIGEIKDGEVKAKKVTSAEESRKKIKDMLNGN